MFEHLLLLVAVVQAAILVRLLRSDGGPPRSYSLMVGGVLVLAVLAMGQDERFLGVVAIAASALTVFVPSALGNVSRRAFTRGRFGVVARLTQIRAILMPGSGLGEQLPVLAGLALLEREGVAAALAHFRELVREADDEQEGGNSTLIHEQIISTLFFGHRWSEGIEHFERRFHLGYAVVRPGLALAMIRAYGESGRMDRAAGLLRAMEGGPVGSDPRAAELLAQARLTFLAYAGQASVVDRLIVEQRHRDLGVSRAAAALFHGIALLRTGAAEAARRRLQGVPELADGGDWQVVHASRVTLAELAEAGATPGPGVAELEPELRDYAEAVAQRLFECLAAPSRLRGRGRTWMTWAMVAGLALAFGLTSMIGRGGSGLLEVGALTPELWHAGSRWRLLTAPWIHADLIGLLLDVYALWVAGQVVERSQGWARMALSTLAGAVGGLLASMIFAPDLVPGVAGGNLLGVSAVVAGLWALRPSRVPNLPAHARRNTLIMLTVIFIAILLATLPGPYGQGASPVALLGCILISSATAIGLPARSRRWLARATAMLAAGLLAATATAAGAVLLEDEEATLRALADRRCSQAEVRLDLPASFMPVAASLDVPGAVPIVAGFLDTLELGSGATVQIAVVDDADGRGSEVDSAWFTAVAPRASAFSSTAVTSLPPELQAGEGDGEEPYRARDILANGEVVARVIERRLGSGAEGRTVLLVAAPPAALERRANAYAQVLAGAEPEQDAAAGGAPTCRP